MRVTFCISSLQCGGAENSLVTLCRYLSESRDIECTIVTSHGKSFFEIPDSIRVIQGDFTPDENENRWLRYLRYLRRARALRRAIVDSDPDIVVAFLDWFTTFTLLSLVGTGIPVVVSERALQSYHPLPIAWRLLTPLAYRLAHGVTFVTKDAERDFLRYRNTPTALVPGPIEPCLDVMRCSRVSRFVAVGRLQEQKGFDRLIKSFKLLNQHKPETSLVIYGEGPLRPSLEQLIRELQLTSVVSLPGLHCAPFETFADGDCFVLASRYEGFLRVLAEAMMRRLPVISFDCPGAPKEIIRNNINGILIPEGDIEGLAQAMTRMIEESALVARFSRAAPSVAEIRSPDAVGDRWLSFLSDIVSQARPGRAVRNQS